MKKSLSNQNNMTLDEQMILSHLRLVKSIAYKLCRNFGCSDLYEDMVSEGSSALMDAVRNFKPEMGVTLACYAYPWIHKAMLKYIKKEKRQGIHVSRTFLALVQDVKKVLKVLDHKRETASLQTIAAMADSTVEETEKALHFLALSFCDVDSIHPSDEEKISLKKQPESGQNPLSLDFGMLEEKVQKLRPEWRIMIMKHYIESKSFTQIAVEMNQKIATIKVWHKRALASLRKL